MLLTFSLLLYFLLTNSSFAVNIQSEEVTPKPAEESGTPLECVDTMLDSTMLEVDGQNKDVLKEGTHFDQCSTFHFKIICNCLS